MSEQDMTQAETDALVEDWNKRKDALDAGLDELLQSGLGGSTAREAIRDAMDKYEEVYDSPRKSKDK